MDRETTSTAPLMDPRQAEGERSSAMAHGWRSRQERRQRVNGVGGCGSFDKSKVMDFYPIYIYM